MEDQKEYQNTPRLILPWRILLLFIASLPGCSRRKKKPGSFWKKKATRIKEMVQQELEGLDQKRVNLRTRSESTPSPGRSQ